MPDFRNLPAPSVKRMEPVINYVDNFYSGFLLIWRAKFIHLHHMSASGCDAFAFYNFSN